MSTLTFEEQMQEALDELQDQIASEQLPDPKSISAEPDRLAAYYIQHFMTMYVRYLQFIRKFEDCYDQMVQPQRRADMKPILESSIGRLLEIKQILTKLAGEYVDFDEVVVDLKLTPESLEVPIPRYFVDSRTKEIDWRNKLLDGLIAQYQPAGPMVGEEGKAAGGQLQAFTVEQSIRLIQKNERGRQGRQRARFMKEIRLQEERERKMIESDATEVDPEDAARLIQKVFRGYLARKQTAAYRQDELVFLGMAAPPRESHNNPVDKSQRTRQRRKLLQQQSSQEMEQDRIRLRNRILEEEGPRIREDMHDAILDKIILRRGIDGKIPEFPAEGSVKFMSEEPEAPPVVEEEAEGGKDAKGKKGKKGKGDKKEEKGKGKGKKGGKGDDDDEADKKNSAYEIPASKYLPNIAGSTQQYIGVWSEKQKGIDKHDNRMLRREIMVDVEKELRTQVDGLIRVELENLTLALEKDKSGKKKKGGKKKGGKKKGKKGGKEKVKKDPLGGEAVESIFAKLVAQNLVQKCPVVRMADFIGSHNLMGTTLTQANVTPDPSLAQVRECVTEYCILPNGSVSIHENTPAVRGAMLFGPPGSGKTMLVHAVATELGATFINLSPANLAGKFDGSKAVSLMMAMVFRVAKLMAPAVIYIDDADKVFGGSEKKKKSADGAPAPSRIKKDLLSQIKELTPQDRVIVMGASRTPWGADVGDLQGAFQKFIYCVRPDYSSRLGIWDTFIRRLSVQPPPNFDLHTLAHISEGYTTGTIQQVVTQILNPRRIKRLAQHPLSASEFMSILGRYQPVYAQDDMEFRSFLDSLPVDLRKKKSNEEEKAAAAEGDGDDDGKGKKGKKGKKGGKKKGGKKKK